jgi:hypothetical protein
MFLRCKIHVRVLFREFVYTEQFLVYILHVLLFLNQSTDKTHLFADGWMSMLETTTEAYTLTSAYFITSSYLQVSDPFGCWFVEYMAIEFEFSEDVR